MSAPREPLFLARETYRNRRLMDAARLLPFIVAFLFFVPLLVGPDAGTLATSIFLFLIWTALILVNFVISRALARNVDTAPDDAEGG